MIKANWILQRVKLSPENIALTDLHSGESWTYAILEKKINKWISILQESKCKKGDRIAVLSSNRIELFSVMFACGILGLMYVPINWRLSKSEIHQLLDDSSAALLVYELKFMKIACKFEFINQIILEQVNEEIQSHDPLLLHHIDPNTPWFMIYTGGTTGKPKGVVLSHLAINANAVNTITSWSIGENDKTINYMPLFHTGGINALSIPILMAGGTVIVGNKFDAEEALRATDKYKATISLFVPTMYQAMIQTEYFKKSSFDSMRVFLSGGAPCPQKIYDFFREKNLHFKEGYGLTEAGPNNFFICPKTAMKKIGSIGKRMLFNDVTVVKDDGTPCRAHEIGELYVRGKHVFTRYWNNEEETKSVFDGNWLKTGDLAKFDEEGDYYIVGRKKDMIITGGENVYPQEVEQCLLKHELVTEAAVVGIDDEKWGEKVVAFLTLIQADLFKEDHIIEHCKRYLGNYKVPKQFIVLDELPKTDVGKIDKNKLMKMNSV